MDDVGIVAIGRNEGARLAGCLASAAGAGTLVYVDSGSTDGSPALARDLGADVVGLDRSRPFCAARARNAGFSRLLERSPGVRFVQFLDGDCELERSWLARGRAALEAHPRAAIVCGRLRELHPEASVYNRLCDLEWSGPLGEIGACGGIFLARAEAYAEVGGMDPQIVAAEEDDLCVRLRQRGYRIVRVDAAMARHDASMRRFSQWWRRAVRTGYAYAQVGALHRHAPIRLFGREARSAWLWGAVVPAAVLGAAALLGAPALLLFLGYGALVGRLAHRLRRRGVPPHHAWLYGAHCYAAKIPQCLGQLRYAADRLRRRSPRVIEHKEGAGMAAREAPSPGLELRVGLLGAGYIGEPHRRALRGLSGARLVAVCDRVAERAAALASPSGAAHYTSLETMLAAERLDVVHVLLPPQEHFAAARRLLEAGLHVLLEKPMCGTPEECAELLRVAERRGCRVGVSHNFLFSPVVERLTDDVRSGRLGPIGEMTVTWNRELPQLRSGPFDVWMLAEPAHILLEIGSHWIAYLLELVGEPEAFDVTAEDPIELPGGRRFFRRWRIDARRGRTAFALRASFAPGFSEHRVHVRGAFGAATADLEHDLYHRDLPSRGSVDLERFRRLVATAASQAAQAARSLVRFALSTLGLVDHRNGFEISIARAVETFYRGLDRPGSPDPRLCPRRGLRVVELGRAMAERAGVGASPAPTSTLARGAAEVLVLGGGGFIGRELVRQLLASGASVRVLSRGSAPPIPVSAHTRLDVVSGNLLEPGDLDRALDGIRVVYHLARSRGPSWDDFRREDVLGARRVGEHCLKHGVDRLVYTGTIDSYYAGPGAGSIREDTPLDPRLERRNFYARAKAMAEQTLRELPLPLVVARPGIVIGRGGSPLHGAVGLWNGLGVVATWGAGREPLPFVLVEDCADALLRMKEAAGIEGSTFLLVGPPLLSAQAYLDALERFGDFRLQRSSPPIWRFFADDAFRWLAKVALRHPGRDRRPSYRDFASRTQEARYDCARTRETLDWHPCADREALVEQGIRAPLEELFR